MSLHLFELEGVLTLLLLSSLFTFPSLIFLTYRLLQLDQILLLILNTSLKFTFKIVKLSYFVRNSCLTLSLSWPLSNRKSTFVGFKSTFKTMLDLIFSLVNVNLNQLLSDKLDHLNSQLFFFKGTGSVKSLLKNFDGLEPHFTLIMALSKPKQSHKLVLFVLGKGKGTLQETANYITFL